MESSAGQVTAAAARTYQSFFVPALFAPWAPAVADRMLPIAASGPSETRGTRVLDVACGTGVLAEALSHRPGTGVSALDCNEGMLAVARSRSPEVDWVLGRAEALPFEDASFDAVGCQFGLMFFEDRSEALREIARVLAPGGRWAVAVWGSLEETPGYAAMVTLLDRLFGPEIADELRAPFCLGSDGRLAQVLDRAGVEGGTIERRVERARFPSLEDWVRIEIGGWTLADRLDPDQIDRLVGEAERCLARFVAGGRVDFSSPGYIASGTAIGAA